MGSRYMLSGWHIRSPRMSNHAAIRDRLLLDKLHAVRVAAERAAAIEGAGRALWAALDALRMAVDDFHMADKETLR